MAGLFPPERRFSNSGSHVILAVPLERRVLLRRNDENETDALVREGLWKLLRDLLARSLENQRRIFALLVFDNDEAGCIPVWRCVRISFRV